MHENIKFTVRLSKEIKPIKRLCLIREIPEANPDGGVDKVIPPDEDEKRQIGDWQPIYGDSVYGTDHTVYAKFLGEEVDAGFKVQAIQLYIQNYKGPVTIGFNGEDVRIRDEPKTEEDRDGDPKYPERTQYTMSIGLEGLRSKLEDLFVIDQSRIKRIQKDGSDPVELSKQPITIKEGDTLKVEVWFSPANPCITRIYTNKNELKEAQFVDELFMERFGEDVVVSWRGYEELKWIRTHYKGMISDRQFQNAEDNRTVRNQDFILTKSDMSDPDPCEKIYSRFHIFRKDK